METRMSINRKGFTLTVLEDHIEHGELGIKTGKGFYDYTGVDIEELKKKRDEQLFEVFRLAKKFMDDPV